MNDLLLLSLDPDERFGDVFSVDPVVPVRLKVAELVF